MEQLALAPAGIRRVPNSRLEFPDRDCRRGNLIQRKHLFIKMPLSWQIVALFILAIPIACVAWTITHEEVFREPRDYCIRQSENSRNPYKRKFFYLFTLRILLQPLRNRYLPLHHSVQAAYNDWRGYLIGGFALVWVANQYMSLFGRLRLDIKRERVEIKEVEQQAAEPRRKPRAV